MKKYWVAFKQQFQSFLEYRADLAVYTTANAVQALVALTLWLALSSSGAKLQYSRTELVIYFILVGLVEIITVTWGRFTIGQLVNSGGFSKYQLKPFSLMGDYLAENFSQKVYQISFISIVILIAYIVGYYNYGFRFEVSSGEVILAIISLLMSVFIAVYIDLMLGLTFVWVHDIEFLNNFTDLAKALLSGRLIPLAFLPVWGREISIYLPFRYVVSFPIEIFLRRVQGGDLLFGFGIQIIWFVGLLYLYKYTYRKALVSYQGYGA